ncbi:MAG: ADP-ribosylglycohydrolase family protein [Azonexus sp.]|nr:ADP-ribosylglycohydrolase family protein [Azonexus sp.]
MNESLKNRARGCLLGLAVGDAIGTTVEFQARGTFVPVANMVGGGVFNLRAGCWTDDTSMALCLAVSLIETGWNLDDQISRYVRWAREGYMSSNGRCFDIGGTVRNALQTYAKTGNALAGSSAPSAAGNGCIMRLAPVPIRYHADSKLAVDMCGQQSRTTHGAEECIAASRLFGELLVRALNGASKTEILAAPIHTTSLPAKLRGIANGDYCQKMRDEVKGSGYVVESLEASLWCFDQTDNFRDAVLLAANLGDDADTTAAIVGQIAGAFYGEAGIPAAWLQTLAMGEMIGDFAEGLLRRGAGQVVI